MARRSWILALIALAIVAIGLGAAWRAGMFGGREGPAPSAVGGPFQLVDSTGRAVDQSILEGRYTAVFFGYTYCPDFCPLTLQTLIEARSKLGDRADDFQILFISVDPERDTPQQVATYLQNFPGVVGLTGSPAQVDAVVKAYKSYRNKRGEGPDYLMDHTTAVYLMDPKGRFVNAVTHGLGPDQTADVIKRAMSDG